MRTEICETETKQKKINETKSEFFEKINKIDKLQPDSPRKEGKGPKSIRSEMKKKLQPTLQKYKGS